MKEGDCVIIVSSPFHGENLAPGKTGVITGVITAQGEEPLMLSVRMDGPSNWIMKHVDWNFLSEELEEIDNA